MWSDKEKPKLSTAKLTLDHDQTGGTSRRMGERQEYTTP
jgi:hypothetical protein